MLGHYHRVTEDQLEQKFIEVPNVKVQEATHYIPHHAVLKNSSMTPLWIAYNCSAKASKGVPSLNDCLMKGPALTGKLGDILTTFHTNKFAFSADISIGLQKMDCNFTRFLWLMDPLDPKSKIITYRFSLVLFGATSSPFLLQATLDFHLRKSTSQYKTLIRENFYVDNFMGIEFRRFSSWIFILTQIENCRLPTCRYVNSPVTSKDYSIKLTRIRREPKLIQSTY